VVDVRVAVVTGAAGGIGSAICDVMEEQGWRVVPVDCVAVEREGALTLDLADPRAIGEQLGALDAVDALVNNAATQLYRPLRETSTQDWDHVHAVNLRAPFQCVNAVCPQLERASGAVINVASVHAVATSQSIGAYAASKGGLVAYTRAAAIELASRGVRVNAVLPGAIDTPALRDGLDRVPGAERSLAAGTPLGRIGQPSDIGQAVAFLADGERSGFITGACLTVDGGALAQLSTET